MRPACKRPRHGSRQAQAGSRCQVATFRRCCSPVECSWQEYTRTLCPSGRTTRPNHTACASQGVRRPRRAGSGSSTYRQHRPGAARKALAHTWLGCHSERTFATAGCHTRRRRWRP